MEHVILLEVALLSIITNLSAPEECNKIFEGVSYDLPTLYKILILVDPNVCNRGCRDVSVTDPAAKTNSLPRHFLYDCSKLTNTPSRTSQTLFWP